MIHIEQKGHGTTPLVLIHGWGLHGGIWDSILNKLEPHYTLYIIDLPGFGYSQYTEQQNLPSISQSIADKVPDNAIWLGWSYGGLFALQATQLKKPIRGLLLFSSSPKFANDSEWHHAIDAAVLADFSARLIQDYKKTVQQFISVQSMGSATAKAEILTLKKLLFTRPEPDPLALANGLKLLQETDLRKTLQHLAIPCMIILGERDTLIRQQIIDDIQKINPRIKSHVIAGAGHAAFISHPEDFIACINDFTATTNTHYHE